MKVLHLFQEYLSYSESWAYNLLNNVKTCTHAIGAIYYYNNPEYFPIKFQFVELSENLRDFYKNPQKLNSLTRRTIQLKRKFVKQEFEAICKWIDVNNPNLIHIHFGTTAAHFLPILKDLDIPILVSFYGYDYQKAILDDPTLKTKYRKVFELVESVLVEEKGGIDILTTLGCPVDKISICRLGVNVDKIEYRRPKFALKIRLVQIANFRYKKGQSDVINMLARYKDELNERLTMTFIGDVNTEYGEQVKKSINRKGLGELISIFPPIQYAQIHQVLEAYDIFIHPSKFAPDGDSEGGAPTILLDAQAVGLPIISTKHCDIPKYVPEANHDLLVNEGDIDQLYEAVKLLLDTDSAASRSSENGRNHVEVNFSISRNARVLEAKYRSIMSNYKT